MIPTSFGFNLSSQKSVFLALFTCEKIISFFLESSCAYSFAEESLSLHSTFAPLIRNSWRVSCSNFCLFVCLGWWLQEGGLLAGSVMHQYFVLVHCWLHFFSNRFSLFFFHRGHFLLRRVSSFSYLSGGSSFFNYVRFACLPMSLYGSLLVFYWQAIFLLVTFSPFLQSLLFYSYAMVLC